MLQLRRTRRSGALAFRAVAARTVGVGLAITVVAGCTSTPVRSGPVTTTVTRTQASVTTVVITTPPVYLTPKQPTTTPSVAPGTTLGASDEDMRYGTAALNPLKPCSVVDPDAGDLVGLPLARDKNTPNSCAAFAEGVGFGVKISIGDMADAIGKIRRCAFASDEQDQCPLPDITDDFDARTFVRKGVTVITQDIINDDGGYLGAGVAAADNAWVQINVHFRRAPSAKDRAVLLALVDQVLARSTTS